MRCSGKTWVFRSFVYEYLYNLPILPPHSPCFFGLYVHNSSLGLLSWCVPVLLFLSIYLTLVVSCIYSCAHVCFFVRAQMFVISSLLYCNWQLESILHRLHIHIPRKSRRMLSNAEVPLFREVRQWQVLWQQSLIMISAFIYSYCSYWGKKGLGVWFLMHESHLNIKRSIITDHK